MTKKYIGINKIYDNVRIVEITPLVIFKKKWICVAFEEKNINRKNEPHLLFIYNSKKTKHIKDIFEIAKENLKEKELILRIHSECLLGDTFFSDLCDCGLQLRFAFKAIIKNGNGAFIYLRQEGRGIGLRAKLSCLALQEGLVKGIYSVKKHSPDEANVAFGFDIDERTYDIVPEILKIFQVTSCKLISGNPEKIYALNNNGIYVSNIIDMHRYNQKLSERQYLELKEKIKRNYKYNLSVPSKEYGL